MEPAAVSRVRDHCAEVGYTVDGLTALLGDSVSRALLRGDLIPARLALAADESGLGRLARLFLIGAAVSPGADLEPFAALGLVAADGRPLLDLRPYDDFLVVSDLGSEVTGKAVSADHVLGVGAASVTLALATPRSPVGRALDLGTGSGVQALHLSRHASSVVGTDVSARALVHAGLTLALNGVSAELLRGDLTDPVAGRSFDLIAANPPFVVGPPRQGFDYRDGGRGGDGITEELLRRLPALLAPGGTAVLLASWLHRSGEDWRERVGGWLDGSGCDAWVAQREVADPAEHTALWLGDSGSTPTSAEYAGWLGWFAAERVEAVGTGVVALRRTDSDTPSVVLDDAFEAGVPVTGTEVSGQLSRAAWLRSTGWPGDARGLLSAVLVPGVEVVLTQQAAVGDDGWEVVRQQLSAAQRVTATDAVGVELIGACDGRRTVGELLAVLGAAHGFDAEAGLPAVAHLATRGVLISAISQDLSGTAQ